MRNLIERLEKESGSRELDWAIWEHFGFGEVQHPWGKETTYAPNLTTAIGAAIALCERVLPGWSVLLAITPNGAICDVHTRPLGAPDGKWPGHAVAIKPATALCIATLKALSALEDGK